MTDIRTGPRQRAEVDLDHHSPEFREDPFGTFRRNAESRCPVAHSDRYEGFWTLVDYASVFEAARDDDLFNSYPSVGVPASGMPFPILPIESDPPVTQELREVTLRQFSPGVGRRVPARRPADGRRGHRRLHRARRMRPGRRVDDTAAGATDPAAAQVRRVPLHGMGGLGAHRGAQPRPRTGARPPIAGMELFAEINKHMEQRRAEGLGDDLFSDILRGTLNGEPLDDTQIAMYAFLMMLGGMDTTSGFTGNVLLRLCEDDRVAPTADRRSGPDQAGHRRAAAPVHADTWIGPHRLPRRRVPRAVTVRGRPGDPDVGGGQPRPRDVREPRRSWT